MNPIRSVVESRIESSCIVPQTVVGMNAAVAKAKLKMQLRRYLPGVLSKELIHVGPVWRLVTRTDLGVRVEETKCGVGYIIARSQSVSAREVELAVLIVRLARG